MITVFYNLKNGRFACGGGGRLQANTIQGAGRL